MLKFNDHSCTLTSFFNKVFAEACTIHGVLAGLVCAIVSFETLQGEHHKE